MASPKSEFVGAYNILESPPVSVLEPLKAVGGPVHG